MDGFALYTGKLNLRIAAVSLLYTSVFNTVIAVLLTTVGFGGTFIQTLIFSQCIGLSICTAVMTTLRCLGPRTLTGRLALFLVATAAGSAVGAVIGSAAAGLSPAVFVRQYAFFLQVVGVSMIFGFAVSYFFYSREQLAVSAEKIRDERIKRLSLEKQALGAELKLLQAQIEPHFLFNTLSNILSLMDTDADKAKTMQMDLIKYLRRSLHRSRKERTELGDELDLIRAYLDIYKGRMGDRLRYAIDIPEPLKRLPFPPMLMQPLVENAVIHGLEPTVRGVKFVSGLLKPQGVSGWRSVIRAAAWVKTGSPAWGFPTPGSGSDTCMAERPG